jgi:hypothetical protein
MIEINLEFRRVDGLMVVVFVDKFSSCSEMGVVGIRNLLLLEDVMGVLGQEEHVVTVEPIWHHAWTSSGCMD